jgi:hypothetical protein
MIISCALGASFKGISQLITGLSDPSEKPPMSAA